MRSRLSLARDARRERLQAHQKAGRVATGTTGLNIQRVYQTRVPAKDVAGTLAEYFRVREFDAQVFARPGTRS